MAAQAVAYLPAESSVAFPAVVRLEASPVADSPIPAVASPEAPLLAIPRSAAAVATIPAGRSAPAA